MADNSTPPERVCDRFSHRPHETDEPGVEFRDGVWQVRSTRAARQVLREKDATTQAGFTAEVTTVKMKQKPLLFMHGEEHRRQRTAVARYFAPRTVSTRYRALMERRADALVDAMVGRVSGLEHVTLRYSSEVAGEVIGLTNSHRGRMARRLERFFDQPPFDLTKPDLGRSRFQALQSTLKGSWPMLTFFLLDVMPAIRARRKHREDDVISHLLDEGYSNDAILIECVMYGAAGMVTTREFLSMAVLHLLTQDALRQRFLVAEEPERLAILHEILRLEPVVGHLYRRAVRDIVVEDAAGSHTIRAGELIDIGVRQANADPTVVGEEPLRVCPQRPLPKGTGPEVIAFGDGAHKCPGNSLAIQESDAFLRRLLRHDVRIVSQPRLEWDELISGYALRDFRIAVA